MDSRLGEFQTESRAQDVRDVLSPARTTASLRGKRGSLPSPRGGKLRNSGNYAWDATRRRQGGVTAIESHFAPRMWRETAQASFSKEADVGDPAATSDGQLPSPGAGVFLIYQAPNLLRQNYRGMADTLVSNCDLVVTGVLKTPRDYLDLSQLMASRTIHPISKGKGGSSDSEGGRQLFAIKTFTE